LIDWLKTIDSYIRLICDMAPEVAPIKKAT